jgi:hypothetical protein
MIHYALTNYRYSMNTFELHVDQPLDTPGRYEALAHPPPGGAHGGETLAIYYPPAYPPVAHLARLGGVGGNPPASSGEVTVLGAIDIPLYVRGFDISPSGEAYLLAHPEDWTEARLYRLNLETLETEDLGAIATPSPARTSSTRSPPHRGGWVRASSRSPRSPAAGSQCWRCCWRQRRSGGRDA